jgi:hypothetical protein
MTIYRSDGKPYSAVGSLQQFDDSSPDRDLFNKWDEESIRLGGSPLFYYELFVDVNNIDPLYVETRAKIYSKNPVQLWCVYEPIPSQNMQTAFGLDSPDEMTFDLNYKAVLRDLGYAPKIGSRVRTPFLNEDWVIIERKLGEFKKYNALRLQLICQRFQEDDVSGSSVGEKKNADYKII